ncbi:MAG: hypothetical protein JNJ54_19310 [Myxococcaceae bacterium]|nr:hypothetical protein [Myxococcaceae bacterium]
MSLTAAILHAAGDEVTAREHEELVLVDPSEWSPLPWARQPANDDGLIGSELDPDLFHSGNSGIGWAP